MTTTTGVTTYDKLYINGEWVASASSDTIDVIDSVTEDVMARIVAGTASRCRQGCCGGQAGLRDLVGHAGRRAGEVHDSHRRGTRRAHG